MKQKSSKLKRLEKNRYSILTDDFEHCFVCKKSPVDIHEIYGGCNRKISMQNGFCVPLCREHHRLVTDYPLNNRYFQELCQNKFEETHTREEFMDLICRNYLE